PFALQFGDQVAGIHELLPHFGEFGYRIARWADLVILDHYVVVRGQRLAFADFQEAPPLMRSIFAARRGNSRASLALSSSGFASHAAKSSCWAIAQGTSPSSLSRMS